MGDLCIKPGANRSHYRDAQADHCIAHHNLAALCYAVATANRIFDSENLLGKHSISVDMGRAVAAIEQVIKAGTLTELERHRTVFNSIRLVNDDPDEDRIALPCA